MFFKRLTRLNAATQAKPRSPRTKKPRTSRTPRPRRGRDESTLLYWIAGGLIVLIAALLVLLLEIHNIKDWYVNRTSPPQT